MYGSSLLSSAGRKHHFIDEDTEPRNVKRLGDVRQDRGVSSGLPGRGDGGGDRDTHEWRIRAPSCTDTSTLRHTLIQSFGDKTRPSNSYTLTAHTQAHTDTDMGHDGHCTCGWLMHRHGHRGTHTVTLSHTFSHRITDPHAFTQAFS